MNRSSCPLVVTALVLLAGCSRGEAPSAPKDAPSAAAPATAAAAGPTVAGDHFRVEAAVAGPCTVDAECPITVTVTASGGFHINKEFPYKFTGAEAPGVTWLAKDGGRSFGRASGDFVEKDATTGVLTARVKGAGKGQKSLPGTLKFSVCSEANCQMEQAELAVPVTFQCAAGTAC